MNRENWTILGVQTFVVAALLLLPSCDAVFGGGRNVTSEHIFVEPGGEARVATDKKIPITTTDEKGGQHFEEKNLGGMYVVPGTTLKKLNDYWAQGHK